MKYTKQLIILLVICLIGEVLVRFLPFDFPGNIMAMILLLILLVTKVVKERQIKETSDFLLELIGLFILPVAVSMIAHFELISEIWWQLLLISLITLVLTFGASAYTIRITMKIMNRRQRGNQ